MKNANTVPSEIGNTDLILSTRTETKNPNAMKINWIKNNVTEIIISFDISKSPFFTANAMIVDAAR
ncbi:hypothetical protein D3C71_2164320 [compost metagenome]